MASLSPGSQKFTPTLAAYKYVFGSHCVDVQIISVLYQEHHFLDICQG